MKIRTLLCGVTALALALAVPVAVGPVAHADDTTPGSFNTVTAERIVDTRSGLGGTTRLAARTTVTFVATGGQVNVGAVAVNVTAVSPDAAGFLAVYAAGTVRPNASNLNFRPGRTVPNMAVTPVGVGGAVTVYNGSSGGVDVLVDSYGYFVGGANAGDAGTLVPMAAQRFLDTRNAIGAPAARIGPSSGLAVQVTGRGGIPAGASAVVANVTAVNPEGSGFITAYAGDPRPNTSHLNYVTGQDRANLALISLAPDGSLSLYNGSKTSVDLVVDITGYFVEGSPSADGSFVPSSTYRVFDTRADGGSPAPARSTSTVRIFPEDDSGTFAFFKGVAVNVTAVSPQASGYLTTWDGAGPRPTISSSNFRAGNTVAGSLIVPVNADGTISIYNGSNGTVELVVDVTGLFFALPQALDQPMVSPQVRIADALTAMQKFSSRNISIPVSQTTG